jgi:hypothetical protein
MEKQIMEDPRYNRPSAMKLRYRRMSPVTILRLPLLFLSIAALTEYAHAQVTTPTQKTTQSQTPLAAQGSTSPQAQATITITGNVLAPVTTAPHAVLNMRRISHTTTNLQATWGWAVPTIDYGTGTVPAGYMVGLFIKESSQNKWSVFEYDRAPSTQSEPWRQRIKRFHDAFVNGNIAQNASRIFEPGTWCLMLGAASTPDSPGTFIPAPNTATSCVAITAPK